MPDYICPMCEKTFSQKFNFLRHIDKKNKCSNKQIYIDKNNIKEYKAAITCKLCNTLFSSYKQLNDHKIDCMFDKIKFLIEHTQNINVRKGENV